MKTKLFLITGLLVTALGYSQTDSTIISPTAADGNSNINVGDDVGSAGMHNLFIGNEAGENNTGDQNTFISNLAGQNNSTGEQNVFIGRSAGRNNYSGVRNVYIGNAAGQIDSLEQSVMVGVLAGQFNVGRRNTFIGYSTARGVSTTVKNELTHSCVMGEQAGILASGQYNILIGLESGSSCSDNGNIIIGTNAGTSVSGENTIIGHRAGEFASGIGNVFLGHRAGADEAGDNKLYIANDDTPSPLIYGEFDNHILKFNAERVGIGFDNNDEFGDFPSFAGTPDLSSYRLFVRGGVLAEEVRIRTSGNWPDYVFAEGYKLIPLNEVEQYIADNGHLPNMPSAKEVEEEGLKLGNIVKLQQEKIEELTLYLIAQEKEIEQLKAKNKEIDELKDQVQLLLNKQ